MGATVINDVLETLGEGRRLAARRIIIGARPKAWHAAAFGIHTITIPGTSYRERAELARPSPAELRLAVKDGHDPATADGTGRPRSARRTTKPPNTPNWARPWPCPVQRDRCLAYFTVTVPTLACWSVLPEESRTSPLIVYVPGGEAAVQA